jgi:hypothetical protein
MYRSFQSPQGCEQRITGRTASIPIRGAKENLQVLWQRKRGSADAVARTGRKIRITERSGRCGKNQMTDQTVPDPKRGRDSVPTIVTWSSFMNRLLAKIRL